MTLGERQESLFTRPIHLIREWRQDDEDIMGRIPRTMYCGASNEPCTEIPEVVTCKMCRAAW